jgi:hypothetical protein
VYLAPEVAPGLYVSPVPTGNLKVEAGVYDSVTGRPITRWKRPSLGRQQPATGSRTWQQSSALVRSG